MENEARDGERRRYELRRSIQDYGIGGVWFGLGIFLLIAPKIGFVIDDDFLRYAFAAILLPYGGWRIYRGYKKNYYR